jgi:anti-sigma factor RsiW
VSCEQIRDLLHPYLDGELSLEKSLEIERHLAECPLCSERLERHQALRTALCEPGLYHLAPPRLRTDVLKTLHRRRRRSASLAVRARRWAAVAAVLTVAVLAGWGAFRGFTIPSPKELLAERVVSSHVRSNLPGSTLGVISADTHTVKPWFSGKVDFSPPVKNPAKEDYPLLGARLDYFDNHEVAVLVYQRQKHVIDLLVWPAGSETVEAPRTLSRQGYHLAHWSDASLTYWAVSDLNEAELLQFAELIRR